MFLYCLRVNQWNSMFIAFSLIIEGTTEKVLQFMMPLRTIFNQNLGFTEQKMYFGTLQRGVFYEKVYICVNGKDILYLMPQHNV